MSKNASIQRMERVVRGIWSTYCIQRMERVVRGIWSTYCIRSQSDANKLHLMHSYFHAPTALHNEGIWHNCLMGMNYLKLAQITQNVTYLSMSRQLARSLLRLNFDRERYLFRSRTVSGEWDTESTKWPHMRNYNQGFKLTHQIIALVFYSFFESETAKVHVGQNPRNDDNSGNGNGAHRYEVKDGGEVLDLLRLQDAIHQHFFNAERRLYRREALIVSPDCGKERGNKKVEYFRAMDHALLYIAQQRMLQIKMPMHETFTQLDYEAILLDTFQYRDFDRSKMYIHITNANDKNLEGQGSVEQVPEGHLSGHFSWQDAWIIMALSLGKKAPLTELVNSYFRYFQWPGSEEIPFKMICNEPYAHGKTSWGARLQRFTGDNVIAQMMLHWCREGHEHKFDENVERFEKDLEQWLQKFVYNEGQDISDAQTVPMEKILSTSDKYKPLFVKESDFEWPNSLWPMSEYLFSQLFSCRKDLMNHHLK